MDCINGMTSDPWPPSQLGFLAVKELKQIVLVHFLYNASVCYCYYYYILQYISIIISISISSSSITVFQYSCYLFM